MGKDLSMIGRRSGAPLNDSAPAEFPETLTARMLARVNVARLLVDRRANATRPKSGRQRPARPASTNSLSLEEVESSIRSGGFFGIWASPTAATVGRLGIMWCLACAMPPITFGRSPASLLWWQSRPS